MSGERLLTEVRALARRRGRISTSVVVDRFSMDDWQHAEQALVADVAVDARRGKRLVAVFAALAEADGRRVPVGRAARLAGSYLSLHARHAESLAHYERAESLLRGAARDGARIGRAAALLRLSRFDDAVTALGKARSAARRRGDPLLEAAANMNLGVAYSESGQPRRALRPYEAAVDAFRSVGAALHAGMCSGDLAVALLLLDRFDEAEARFEEASSLLAGAGAVIESAWCRYNEGILLHVTGRYADALDLLERATDGLEPSAATEIAARTGVERGAVLMDAGLPEHAVDLLREARTQMSARTAPGEVARARVLHASALVAAGDAAAAARLLRGPVAPFEVEADELRGRISIAAGRLDDAASALDRSARAARRSRPSVAARCLSLAATCALRAGDIPGARALVRRALSAARVGALPDTLFIAHAALFLVESEAGRSRQSGDALRAALAALEDVRARRGGGLLRDALLVGREAWFARAVLHVLETDGPRAAHDLIEGWRSRALLDLLAEGEFEQRDVAALRAELRALEGRLAGGLTPPLVRGAVAATTPPDPVRLRDAVRRTERKLARALSASHPSAVSEASPERALRRVRSEVGADCVVVSLACVGDETLLFDTARPDDVVRLGLARDEVSALLSEIRVQLGRLALGADYALRHRARIAHGIRRALEALGEPLLGTISGRIRDAQRLVVVPDGPWHGVPFGALPFDGAPLAATVPVAVAPSVALLGSEFPIARGAPVVVGVADDRAPGMRDEARDVASILGHRSRLLEGREATFAALSARRNPACLHVAAHGRFRPDQPAMSAMRIGDGWLRAAEWPQLRLNGSLVVLSGCDTGVSAGQGSELAGLVRGVLAAGAVDVVTGLFAVPDAPTARLMTRFHATRATHRDAATALAAAQSAAARAGEPVWEWCGFSVWSRRLSAR